MHAGAPTNCTYSYAYRVPRYDSTRYPLVGPQGACEIQDSIGVYVTTGSLVFYCFGPTDRKTKWGHSLCGNMYLMIMVKDRERASSEYIRI